MRSRYRGPPDLRRLALSVDFASPARTEDAYPGRRHHMANLLTKKRWMKWMCYGLGGVSTSQIRFAFDMVDHTATRADVIAGSTVEYGQMLAGACVGCHGGNYTGGPIPGGDPSWPQAKNLTLHATGLQSWSLDDFKTALRQGRRPDDTAISSVMPWPGYAGMTDSDVEAIYRYLQTVEPREMGNR
jgi:mono/diheme cytochrome c family protein